ncbi:hypothetical protein B0T25DRAFT_458283 [Lasiosphaeria hispida]|uniref:Cardiolipin synthase N-terminal domain-containing protein n=1 Tax=Lasiosphaeria hispida TaxID=260671 RepID=A0AAJ0HDW7_9PEZI|nr:hypothetical protein B0T25DRAFT_458283 [Lasiosphaeria hispida]
MQNALFSAFVAQLCMASLALAAPIAETTTTAGNAWQYGTGGGVLGLLVLILDIIVFLEVIKSNRPPSHKIIWCLVVFLFPIVGMAIYWLFSNRAAHNSGSGYEALP